MADTTKIPSVLFIVLISVTPVTTTYPPPTDCGEPGKVQHAIMTQKNGTTYQSWATYKCYTGYDLTGNPNITCQNNGNWSEKAFACKLKDCGEPCKEQNANMKQQNGTTYQSWATCKCYTGYDLTGDPNITCQDNGIWSKKAFNCTPKDCGEPGKVQNANMEIKNGTTYQSWATYKCYTGYDLTGDPNRTCQDNGNWSEKAFTCKLKDCGEPGELQNANMEFKNGTTYQSWATYKCYTGYDLTGDPNRTCQDNGNWSEKAFACKLKDCGEPYTAQNAIVEKKNGTTYQSWATYKCTAGYDLTGDPNITCQHSGNWSVKAFNCRLKGITFGGDCDEDGPNEQCVTKNASCINAICSCNDNRQYVPHDGHGECALRPGLPDNFLVEITHDNVFNAYFIVNIGNIPSGMSVFGTIDPSTLTGQRNFTDKSGPYLVKSLYSGKSYTVCIYVIKDNVRSKDCREASTFTVPEDVTQANVSDIREDGFTIFWDSSKLCEKYQIDISSSEKSNSFVMNRTQNVSNLTFHNLTGSTNYTITITAIAGQFNSEKFIMHHVTRPLMLADASVIEQHNSSLEIEVSYVGHLKDKIMYCIQIPTFSDLQKDQADLAYQCDITVSDDDNHVICTADSRLTVQGLTPGTEYTFQIYTCLQNLSSEQYTTVESMTRPDNFIQVDIKNWNETSLEVSIYSNDTAEKIKLQISSEHGNTEKLETEVIRNVSGSDVYTFDSLQAGTKYKVSAYTVIGSLSSENAAIVKTYTRPLPTTIIGEEKLGNGFNLTVNTSMFFNMLRITVVSADWEYKITTEKEFKGGSSAVEINNLTEGSYYNVSIQTIIYFDNYTIESLHEMKQQLFTRPGLPRRVAFPLSVLHENSFVVNIEQPEAGRFDNFCVYLGPSKQTLKKNCTLTNETSEVTFSNLEPGVLYNISVYTTWLNTDSITGLTASIHTRPTPPVSLLISIIEEQSFRILVDVGNKRWDFYSFIFVPPVKNVTNITEAPGNITVVGLKAGTLYNVTVYSIIGGISSERVKTISTYTKPGKVGSVAVVPTNSNSSLQVRWDKPEGYNDKFVYNATCTSPNTDSSAPSDLSNDTVEATALLSPLDPGTYCSISVVAVIINIGTKELLKGSPVIEDLSVSTREAAPSNVKLLHNTSLTHNSTTVQWVIPGERNGVIRRYEAVLWQNGTCRSKRIFSCTQAECGGVPEATEKVVNDRCTESTISNESFSKNTESFTWTIDRLHPFRSYSIEVVAFTVVAGAKANISIETLEDRPGIPLKLSTNATSNIIDLTWDPPKERNGIIRNYTVKYKYARNNCYSKGDTVSDTIFSTEKPLNHIQLIGPDIYPYWTYTITVLATNNVGTGDSSVEKNVTTSESKPGIIENITVGKPTSFNVIMSWSPPCDANGIIHLYYICLTNDSSTDHDLDVWKKCYNTTDIDVRNELNIFPYRNYSFSVSAVNTAGVGNLSKTVRIKTPFAPPERPTSLKLTALESDEIGAVWNKPSLFYGPVHYFLEAIDVKDPLLVYNKKTTIAYWTDSISTSSSISGLDAFWEYNITVYAVTGNERRSSQSKLFKTKEANPGPVRLVYGVSESDVKKERSISVHWDKPIERDLNGIITSYRITCSKSDDRSITFSNYTDANKREFKFMNIPPGNYNITVAANNSAGIGVSSLNTTHLKAGAPILLVEETDSNLLIKPSPGEVSDKERQISVQLPLRDLLCNFLNGQPVHWGVVVVQDGNQYDVPFTGTLEEFKSQRLSVYKRWSEIKDADSIPAYVATPEDWSPGCSPHSKGNRKKRSADPDAEIYEAFLVGEQGECSGVPANQYCNGELQPDRSYRAKAYVCTSEGCTETRYSNPISTDQDLTIPIIAGTSSAIVVLVVVFVVVFILRRKHAVCFVKDPERTTSTHRTGVDIHLDNTESTKKNSFRPWPIKLSDFPDAVENMHKDTDLLFADAYKLLKERSPNHPMTAAEQQCCRPKNRYTNILPFDHSRVKLRPSDDMEGSDYINANYIPGYTSRREYIATQGAMQATFDDFWRMIWEQNVDTVVMLTKLMEKGRHKCDKYWPDLGEPVFYGDLVVSLQSESNLSDYTIKIFEVKMKEERKMVRHFSYLKWPDMGCPDTPELLLEFVKAVRQYTNQEKKTTSGPTVVHCSAGVGRTGTFIAVDYLLQHIRDHDEVDIFSFVLEMRNHRLNMVQTEDQYVYIHECLKAFISTDEEEEDEADDEHLYVNTSFGAQEENVYENAGYQKD